MIVRGFKSVIWVATVGGAALSCYMVSLQVATERAELAKVERQIIAAKREIRSLQTELGTRGRLSQLEHWNAEVLALSAPSSAQFLSDGVKLARFERRDPALEDRTAQVRMAALRTDDVAPVAPVAPAKPAIVPAVAPAPATAAPVVHRASFTPGTARATTLPAAARAEAPKPRDTRASARTAAVTTGEKPAVAAKGAAEAPAKAVLAKPSARPEPKPAAKAAVAKAPVKGETKPAAKAVPTIAARAPAARTRTSKLDGKLVAEINGHGSGGN